MTKDLFSLSSYMYELPQELIAQTPCTPRDESRLMVVERETGRIYDCVFRDLPDILESEDSLIFNDTKVIPARLIGKRTTGGQAELLLVRRFPDDTWEAMGRPGRKLGVGTKIVFGDRLSAVVVDVLPGGERRVRFECDGVFEELLEVYGRMPLPQYIKRMPEAGFDSERYQTVYARSPGAVAAPTAGLHFTGDLLTRLAMKGIDKHTLTLHVGLGTFKPVQTEDIRLHPMHTELFSISPDAAEAFNRPVKGRRICVGTTCCRALESAASEEGYISAGYGETNIFIYPGYRFKFIKHLLTNFHTPGSSLLMLVSAFAGHELIMEAYAKAIERRYRFFSYGDAMLIL